jgi:uncharacterized protein (TIGR00369 family)
MPASLVLQDDGRSSLLVGQPLVSEMHERDDHWIEVDAFFSEAILVTVRSVGRGPTNEHSLVNQSLETLGQDGPRGGRPSQELFEPSGPEKSFSKDQHGPSIPDHRKGPGHRTVHASNVAPLHGAKPISSHFDLHSETELIISSETELIQGGAMVQLTDTAEQPQMSGLDLIRSFQQRGPAPTGVAHLLGARIVLAEEGHVQFAAETRADFGNPMGTLHGGIAATMLDSALGCAVMSALPAGDSYTTLDLMVTYLRPGSLDGVTLIADGLVTHLGGRMATAEGKLMNPDGKLIATATTTCMVFRQLAA